MKRSPMKRANPERRAKAFARNYGERGALVRAMSCLVAREAMRWAGAFAIGWTPCSGHVQACHARARGMGGVKGDSRDLWPGCDGHHREAGEKPQMGRTDTQRHRFEARYGLDLEREADEIAARLDDRGAP